MEIFVGNPMPGRTEWMFAMGKEYKNSAKVGRVLLLFIQLGGLPPPFVRFFLHSND